jgi:hypothetical protein
MALFAHARIEDPDNPGATWERGDEVSDADAERLGLSDEYGALSEEPYDPESDKNEPPQYIEIDGVRYERKAPEPHPDFDILPEDPTDA